MRILLHVTAAAAAIAALSACDELGIGGGDDNNQAASNVSAGNESAGGGGLFGNRSRGEAGGKDPIGGEAPAATQSAGGLSEEWLIGRWTDNGDCNLVTQFTSDGGYIAPNGVRGRWTLEGDRLTFIGTGRMTITIEAESQDSLVATLPNGTRGRSTRC